MTVEPVAPAVRAASSTASVEAPSTNAMISLKCMVNLLVRSAAPRDGNQGAQLCVAQHRHDWEEAGEGDQPEAVQQRVAPGMLLDSPRPSAATSGTVTVDVVTPPESYASATMDFGAKAVWVSTNT
jgi:hypothetical protein